MTISNNSAITLTDILNSINAHVKNFIETCENVGKEVSWTESKTASTTIKVQHADASKTHTLNVVMSRVAPGAVATVSSDSAMSEYTQYIEGYHTLATKMSMTQMTLARLI